MPDGGASGAVPGRGRGRGGEDPQAGHARRRRAFGAAPPDRAGLLRGRGGRRVRGGNPRGGQALRGGQRLCAAGNPDRSEAEAALQRAGRFKERVRRGLSAVLGQQGRGRQAPAGAPEHAGLLRRDDRRRVRKSGQIGGQGLSDGQWPQGYRKGRHEHPKAHERRDGRELCRVSDVLRAVLGQQRRGRAASADEAQGAGLLYRRGGRQVWSGGQGGCEALSDGARPEGDGKRRRGDQKADERAGRDPRVTVRYGVSAQVRREERGGEAAQGAAGRTGLLRGRDERDLRQGDPHGGFRVPVGQRAEGHRQRRQRDPRADERRQGEGFLGLLSGARAPAGRVQRGGEGAQGTPAGAGLL